MDKINFLIENWHIFVPLFVAVSQILLQVEKAADKGEISLSLKNKHRFSAVVGAIGWLVRLINGSR